MRVYNFWVRQIPDILNSIRMHTQDFLSKDIKRQIVYRILAFLDSRGRGAGGPGSPLKRQNDKK